MRRKDTQKKTKHLEDDESWTQDILVDQNDIRVALSTCNGVPNHLLPHILEPVGYATFMGDDFHDKKRSDNGHFTKGKEYPVYKFQGCIFAITDYAGTGRRFKPEAWKINT